MSVGTYNIRVGRSQNILGPFFDRTGRNMLDGGGSLFLDTEGRMIGPGHAGFITTGTTNWVSFHYYDRELNGASTLGIRRVYWGANGWPQLQQDAAASAKAQN